MQPVIINYGRGTGRYEVSEILAGAESAVNTSARVYLQLRAWIETDLLKFQRRPRGMGYSTDAVEYGRFPSIKLAVIGETFESTLK